MAIGFASHVSIHSDILVQEFWPWQAFFLSLFLYVCNHRMNEPCSRLRQRRRTVAGQMSSDPLCERMSDMHPGDMNHDKLSTAAAHQGTFTLGLGRRPL